MYKRVWIGLIVLLALVLSSCAPAAAPAQPAAEKPASAEPITLKLWVTEDNQVFFPELIKAFEAKYPNIKVETTLIPEEQYGTKIETALAAGAPPDIAYVGERRWYREGVVLPLDDIIAKEGIDLSTWNASIIGPKGVENAEEACKFEDKVYCLGSYTGAVVLFYNKDMFDAAGLKYPTQWPPISIDEYVDLACKLTKPDEEVWGTANGDPVTWLPWETIVSPDGRTVTGIVNGPTSVGVHEKIAGLFQNGCAPSLNVMDPWQQGVDFFSQGKIAMVVTDFQSLFKIENAKINYGVAHPPSPDGVTPFFNVWTDGLGVFAKAAHPEEAKLFIAFQGTEGQRIRVKVTGDFPVSTAIAEEMNWAGDVAGRKEALEVLKHARPNVYMPNRWEVAGPLFDAFGYIVSKEKTTQDALDEAAPLMQENLDKEWASWEK